MPNVIRVPVKGDKKLLLMKPEGAQKMIKRIDKWLDKQCDDPKVSATKLHHYETAAYAAKFIIRDAFGLKQKMEFARTK